MTNNGTPQWVNDMRELLARGVSHAFILHGNVEDYPTHTRTPLTTYIANILAQKTVFLLSRSHGLTPMNNAARSKLTDFGSSTVIQDPLVAIATVENIAQKEGNVVLIITQPQALFPNSDWALLQPADRVMITRVAELARNFELGNKGCIFIIIAATLNDLHPEVRYSRFRAIPIPLPNEEERERFIRYIVTKEQIQLHGLSEPGLAKATRGLSRISIDDLLLYDPSLETLGRMKEEIFARQFAHVLSILPQEQAGFARLGGIGRITQYIRETVISPMQEGRYDVMPMGILLMGPPGTGKSVFARSLAAELGIMALQLRIGGQIASKWQGEGERNLALALNAIESLAPVLVFIDELDQNMRRMETGNENMQEARIFQMLMEFMSDTNHRGKVLFVAATNRPDLLDPALKRPGRFDVKIPFLPPDRDGRAEIFSIFAKKFNLPHSFPLDETSGWTGAQIERLAIKAKQLADRGEPNPWTEGIARIRVRVYHDEVRLALEEADDLDLAPDDLIQPVTEISRR